MKKFSLKCVLKRKNPVPIDIFRMYCAVIFCPSDFDIDFVHMIANHKPTLTVYVVSWLTGSNDYEFHSFVDTVLLQPLTSIKSIALIGIVAVSLGIGFSLMSFLSKLVLIWTRNSTNM